MCLPFLNWCWEWFHCLRSFSFSFIGPLEESLSLTNKRVSLGHLERKKDYASSKKLLTSIKEKEPPRYCLITCMLRECLGGMFPLQKTRSCPDGAQNCCCCQEAHVHACYHGCCREQLERVGASVRQRLKPSFKYSSSFLDFALIYTYCIKLL